MEDVNEALEDINEVLEDLNLKERKENGEVTDYFNLVKADQQGSIYLAGSLFHGRDVGCRLIHKYPRINNETEIRRLNANSELSRAISATNDERKKNLLLLKDYTFPDEDEESKYRKTYLIYNFPFSRDIFEEYRTSEDKNKYFNSIVHDEEVKANNVIGILKYISQLLDVVKFMHNDEGDSSSGLAHRDITVDNIYTYKSSMDPEEQKKICLAGIESSRDNFRGEIRTVTYDSLSANEQYSTYNLLRIKANLHEKNEIQSVEDMNTAIAMYERNTGIAKDKLNIYDMTIFTEKLLSSYISRIEDKEKFHVDHPILSEIISKLLFDFYKDQDLFSVGTVLYRLLKGNMPRESGRLNIIANADDLSFKDRFVYDGLDKCVEEVCGKALDTDITKRYKSAGEFKNAIDECIEEIVNYNKNEADKSTFITPVENIKVKALEKNSSISKESLNKVASTSPIPKPKKAKISFLSKIGVGALIVGGLFFYDYYVSSCNNKNYVKISEECLNHVDISKEETLIHRSLQGDLLSMKKLAKKYEEEYRNAKVKKKLDEGKLFALKSMEWYQQAFENGYTEGLYKYTKIKYELSGINTQNKFDFLKELHRIAKYGSLKAIKDLEVIYEKGLYGIKKDEKKVKLSRIAQRLLTSGRPNYLFDAKNLRRLIMCYEKGKYFLKSSKKAKMWISMEKYLTRIQKEQQSGIKKNRYYQDHFILGGMHKRFGNYELAEQHYRKSAESNEAAYMYQYALMLLKGDGVKTDTLEGIKILKSILSKHTQDDKHTLTLCKLGEIYEYGLYGQVKNLEEATNYYFEAWEAEKRNLNRILSREGHYNMYRLIKMGKVRLNYKNKTNHQDQKFVTIKIENQLGGDEQIVEDMLQEVLMKEESNISNALYYKARSLWNMEKDEAQVESLRLYEESAKLGNTKSKLFMAMIYEKKICSNYKKSIEKAVELYRDVIWNGNICNAKIAAENLLNTTERTMNTDGLYESGKILFTGIGINKNELEGINYLTLAANKEHLNSIMYLANIYYEGSDEIGQDYKKSSEYSKKALEILGDKRNGLSQNIKDKAYYYIGKSYMQSDNTDEIEEGLKYLKLSSNNGGKDANITLADYYYTIFKQRSKKEKNEILNEAIQWNNKVIQNSEGSHYEIAKERSKVYRNQLKKNKKR